MGGGAFELCLPSLGFFLTKYLLRLRFWATVDHMIKVRTLAGMSGLEHYEVGTLDHRSYGQQPCGHHYTDQDEDHLGLRRYLFRMYWATPMIQNIAVQNRK